jgi:hypothetical protein
MFASLQIYGWLRKLTTLHFNRESCLLNEIILALRKPKRQMSILLIHRCQNETALCNFFGFKLKIPY